jgi:hypothetical protein
MKLTSPSKLRYEIKMEKFILKNLSLLFYQNFNFLGRKCDLLQIEKEYSTEKAYGDLLPENRGKINKK